jgi:hypothetical protein
MRGVVRKLTAVAGSCGLREKSHMPIQGYKTRNSVIPNRGLHTGCTFVSFWAHCWTLRARNRKGKLSSRRNLTRVRT